MLTNYHPWRHGLMRFLFVAGFLVSLPLFLSAQNADSREILKWHLSKTLEGVDFYYSFSECEGKKVVLLKFDNKNKYSVKVAWKEQFTTQLETKVEGAKGVKEMTIAPGITAPSGCGESIKSRRPAIITSYDVQPHYVAEIKTFDFLDISVGRVK